MTSPLQLPEYRAFLQLRFFLATGWHMQGVVIAWYVYAITKDPFMLGMVGLAEAIPAIGAALPMGYVIERMEKRRAVRIALTLIVVSAMISAVLLQPSMLPSLGKPTVIGGLLAMIMVNGFARSMYSPSMFSMLSAIVPRDLIPQGTALSSTVWQGAVISGPLAAGLVYGHFGVTAASVTYVLFMIIGSLGVLRLTPKPALLKVHGSSMKEDLTKGIDFIFSNKIILGALSLDLFAVLFGGVTALLPVFADTVLHVGESGLGLLRASMSIGSVIMMAWLSYRPPTRNAGRNMLLSVAAYGGCMLSFALSTSFVLSVGLLVLAGIFDSVSVVTRQTILQLYTPEDMKGRVAAANTMFVSSSNELGAVESGISAKLFGTVPSVLIGGTITLIVVAVVTLTSPALRTMDLSQNEI